MEKVQKGTPEPPSKWKEEITRAICRRCSSPCCTHPKVYALLDYEKEARTLGQYKYTRSDQKGAPPFLKKDRNGACVYFDHNTKSCDIYDRRPMSCRAWFCGRGTRDAHLWHVLIGRCCIDQEAMRDHILCLLDQ